MPEATQQQVGEVIHADRTTTVKKVDHLESLGYLIRVKNTVDCRMYNLQPTDKSEHMLKQLWPLLINCERSVLSPLMDEEVENLNNIFIKLVKAWK